MSEMHRRLLSLPGRRETITPELVRFFEKRPRDLLRFVKALQGCVEIKVPGVREVQDLERDVDIGYELSPSMSNDERVAVCRKHRVTYRHIQEIARVGLQEELLELLPPTAEAKAIEAARLVKKFPGADRVVSEMLQLTDADKKRYREILKASK